MTPLHLPAPRGPAAGPPDGLPDELPDGLPDGQPDWCRVPLVLLDRRPPVISPGASSVANRGRMVPEWMRAGNHNAFE